MSTMAVGTFIIIGVVVAVVIVIALGALAIRNAPMMPPDESQLDVWDGARYRSKCEREAVDWADRWTE